MAERGEDQREQQRRGAVVEQALALDDEPQPALDAGLAQHGDDGDRIGGGDQRAEGERRRERPVERPHESAGDDASAEQHADRRQRQHRREIAPELAPRDAERRLEQQRRQDHLEQDVVGQREVERQPRQRQRQPGRHQADGVGQAKAAGDDRHRHGDPEQLDP